MEDKLLSEGLVRHFITINEPAVILMNGYMFGIFPPYKKGSIIRLMRVLSKLVEAHEIALGEIKQSALNSTGFVRTGVAHNWTYFDGLLGGLLNHLINEKITERFEKGILATDFIGVQYYCRMTVPSLYWPIGPIRPRTRHYGDHPDFGDVYPRGLLSILMRLNKLYPTKDIFITEFGFSDGNDTRRAYWILETFHQVVEALKYGVSVKGILLWTLVNNFEWTFGMAQKFGLFDECELSKPLQRSGGNEIRGWEAWCAITNAIKNPSVEAMAQVQKHYELARQQFAQAAGVASE